jgi:hypothetical protein
MKTLTERQILSNIHLSDNQKIVMTKIIAAGSPQIAYETVSTGQNIIVARDTLIKLGLLQLAESTVEITEDGMTIMRDANLLDEGDQLTEEGQKYAYVEDPMDLQKADATKAAPEPNTGTEEPGLASDEPTAPATGGMEEEPALENWSLIRSISGDVLREDLIKKLNR